MTSLAGFLNARSSGMVSDAAPVSRDAPEVRPSSPVRLAPHGVRHILVCVDRSAGAQSCITYAALLARVFGSAMTLLHVLQPPRGIPPQAPDVLAWEIAREEASVHLDLCQDATRRALGASAAVRLEEGHPAERILALTRELATDLIVLGSRGEGASAEWTLGSTVQQVLASSRSSVLVARGPHGDRPAPKRILVPLDGSLRTESVLPIAARIAAAHGAERSSPTSWTSRSPPRCSGPPRT